MDSWYKIDNYAHPAISFDIKFSPSFGVANVKGSVSLDGLKVWIQMHGIGVKLHFDHFAPSYRPQVSSLIFFRYLVQCDSAIGRQTPAWEFCPDCRPIRISFSTKLIILLDYPFDKYW